MGTSTSSSGPGGNIPFDPPWLDDENASESKTPNVEQELPLGDNNNDPDEKDNCDPVVLAPQRRFSDARRNLNRYLYDGDKQFLGKAFGGYSGRGMGGATRLANRMQKSTQVGSSVYSLFQEIRNGAGSDPQTHDLIRYLASESSSSENFKNAIIKHVLPLGGSLDEEACRSSLAQAMSDLLQKQPEINLAKLENAEILTLLEYFITNEIVNRVSIDLGQAFESQKFSPQEIVTRRRDMKEYVHSAVSEEFRKIIDQTPNPISSAINNILKSVLRATFEVFEGYL